MEGNAIIEGTSLGELGRGFSSYIYLKQGCIGQGFGGYSLGGVFLDCWIKRILEVVGVEKWEDLMGKYVRVKGDDQHLEAIGNIVEDKWFCPKDEFDRLKELK